MDKDSCSNQEIHELFEHGFKRKNTSNKFRLIYLTLYAESAGGPD